LILTPALFPIDHSTISKIIGVCWRTLPARQRKRWEQKALEAKAAHKKQYPDYRYTPVHRKGPSRKKAKKEQKKDDARCEELAQLLLSGTKGADLEERVKKLDESNPDSYQSTLSFSTPADQQQQQFTFVQGFPAAGHSIQVPTAPNMYQPQHYNPNMPRRHSSAPPADNAFLEANNGSSSSAASSPRTSSRDLSLHNEGDNISPTDTLVPLSRIARKLPTKSTHHLQPHHFRDEANVLAAAAHASASGNRKIKSSMSKAIRSRAQGFGAPQPASERDQLFIQSHWTNASLDPSTSTAGERKKKTKRQPIPQDMLMAPWDLNGNSQSNNASPTITSHAVPLPTIPGYISTEHYSPSYAPAYIADDKYSQYDGAGVGPFDMLTYQDYGLTGLDVDPLGGGDATLNAALNGVGAVSGFDFADQFGALGVDVDANEDYVCFIASLFWKTALIFLQ
jgi:HMG (high mobility group) box